MQEICLRTDGKYKWADTTAVQQFDEAVDNQILHGTNLSDVKQEQAQELLDLLQFGHAYQLRWCAPPDEAKQHHAQQRDTNVLDQILASALPGGTTRGLKGFLILKTDDEVYYLQQGDGRSGQHLTVNRARSVDSQHLLECSALDVINRESGSPGRRCLLRIIPKGNFGSFLEARLNASAEQRRPLLDTTDTLAEAAEFAYSRSQRSAKRGKPLSAVLLRSSSYYLTAVLFREVLEEIKAFWEKELQIGTVSAAFQSERYAL